MNDTTAILFHKNSILSNEVLLLLNEGIVKVNRVR